MLSSSLPPVVLVMCFMILSYVYVVKVTVRKYIKKKVPFCSSFSLNIVPLLCLSPPNWHIVAWQWVLDLMDGWMNE